RIGTETSYMRVTARSGWKARRLARAQDEAGDRRLEWNAVLAEEAVIPFHKTLARLENAEALILVHGGRSDHRLVADDPFAKDFRVFADRIVDQPAPVEQLCRLLADILDAHVVREDIMSLRGLGMLV